MWKTILWVWSTLILVVSADRTALDERWKFIQQDLIGAERLAFDDAAWRVLDVPHDWSIEGEYAKDHPMGAGCGYLPAGIGWYRKTIPVSPTWKGKHVEIAFDGVYMNSTVWANGTKLGTRPYGWSSFAYDISDLVDAAETITFAVRVDNEKQPSARWYTGSGIYAHVWLDVKQPVHIPANGIFVRTEGAAVKIDTDLANTSSDDWMVKVQTSVVDAQGKRLKRMDELCVVPAGESRSVCQALTLSNPARWSLDRPTLHTAISEVWINGAMVDRVTTRFGIRDVEWKPESGMWLNGENVKLQGVCNHQDAGALGAAVPDSVLRFRIEQLKAMGCNAIRTSHNPQTPIFYDICDEVGMLVMDEIFDGWRRKAKQDYGARFFKAWWERDLTDWIKRDRNHPSVVVYSVGNETRGPVAADIVALCHALDPTRPVTSGHSGAEHMDLLGVNGGSERVGWFDRLKTDRVFIGTENTHTWQVRGYYRTQTWYRDGYSIKKGVTKIPNLTEKEIFTHDWVAADQRGNRKQIFNSSYDNATVRLNARKNIEQLRDIPNYAGSFRWTGYDYIGEASYVHGGWPFKSFMGGAIDMANFEKDLYYLYQSQWTTKPMVHMLPHWTHPKMKAGTEIPVWVYSNCDEVELFFCGASLGKKSPGTAWNEMQCQWMVPWQPGELKAVGYQHGHIEAEQIIRTAHAPSQNVLSIDGAPLATEGKGMVQVRVTAADTTGEPYPYGENRTYFHVMGPAKIRALDNGSPVDVEKHFEAESRIAFYGLTRAYIESTGAPGDIALLASCILGEKKLITSNFVSIDARLLSLRGPLSERKIEIFYTTDGSAPTPLSMRYAGAFPVSLGTTVKALVVVDGQSVQILEERFAAEEGFVWNDAPPRNEGGGDQAEDAVFKGAQVIDSGSGFEGKGFLDFGQNRGGYVEWYQENDGEAGPAELTIRYSGKAGDRAGRTVRLTVNDQVIEAALLLPNTQNWGTDWQTVTVGIPLGRGANTIRLTTMENGGMYIDSISVQ